MFQRVTIIGPGLLGASLGLALKGRGLAAHVVGVGRPGSPSVEKALSRGAIDEAQTDPSAGVIGSDLVVLCTALGQFPNLCRQIGPRLERDALVTDVGSTKRQVMEWARELLPPRTLFIGSHPMAGSEKRGPDHARPDLFENALCLVCPASRPGAARSDARHRHEKALDQTELLWRGIGMRTLCLTAHVHDIWVAQVSHLPHVAACCLMAAGAARPEALQAAAGGFLDTTRVASGDVDVWADIFATNGPAVAKALGNYIDVLQQFQKALAAGDQRGIRRRLSFAKAARDELLASRASPRPPEGG